MKKLFSSLMALMLSVFMGGSSAFAQTDITSILGDPLSGWSRDSYSTVWHNGGATSANPGKETGAEYRGTAWEIWTGDPNCVVVGRPMYKSVTLPAGSYVLKAAVQTCNQQAAVSGNEEAYFYAGDVMVKAASQALKYQTLTFTIDKVQTVEYGIKYNEAKIANWTAIADITLTTTSYSSVDELNAEIDNEYQIGAGVLAMSEGKVPTDKLDNWRVSNLGDGEKLQVNTWSGEGATDGSNMLTPFIENWHYRGTNLVNKTITYPMKGLEEGWYEIGGLFRCLNEQGGVTPSGIYMTMNADEYDMTEGAAACNNGSYKKLTKAVKVGSDGVLVLGVKIKDANVNWINWRDFTIKQMPPVTQDDIDAEWAKIPEGRCDADVKAAAEAAKAAVEATLSPADFAALKEAVSACVLNAQGWAQVEASVDATFAALDAEFANTNVYTAEAMAAYQQLKADYNNGNMTLAQAKAISLGSGHRSPNTYDDVLLSAWTINGEQCNNYDKALYINTWSTEGNGDGSNFKVPFFEYWTGDGNSLGTATMTATVSGLLPGGKYSVSSWTRVRIKNGAETPATGITFKVGDGEAVNACAGAQVGTSQMYLATITAEGRADQDGNLTISYVVADGNNVSWLSWKNVMYAEAPEYTTVGKSEIDGSLYVVEAYNDHVIIKAFDGIEGRDLMVGVEEEMTATSVSILQNGVSTALDVDLEDVYCKNNVENKVGMLYLETDEDMFHFTWPYSIGRGTTAGAFGTICAPVALTSADPNGEEEDCATFYSAELSTTGNYIILTEVEKTEAGKPYIYQATTDDPTFGCAGTEIATAPVANGILTGVFEATPAPVGSYVLQTKEGVQKFYQVAEGAQPTLSANKAYITLPAASEVKALAIGGADETAIKALEALTNNKAEIYDVNGRRLQKLQKGVNIVNGVKMIVK